MTESVDRRHLLLIGAGPGVGSVVRGTAFDPDNIAELFWTAHTSHDSVVLSNRPRRWELRPGQRLRARKPTRFTRCQRRADYRVEDRAWSDARDGVQRSG